MIEAKLKEIFNKLKKLGEIENNIDKITEKVSGISEEIEEHKEENKNLKEKINGLERKLERLELNDKINNLVFKGIPENEKFETEIICCGTGTVTNNVGVHSMKALFRLLFIT